MFFELVDDVCYSLKEKTNQFSLTRLVQPRQLGLVSWRSVVEDYTGLHILSEKAGKNKEHSFVFETMQHFEMEK